MYVVRCINKTDSINDSYPCRLYWSHKNGWGDLFSADAFEYDNWQALLDLPHEGEWVEFSDAEFSHFCNSPIEDGETSLELPSGNYIVFENAEHDSDGTQHVRYVAADRETELAYWIEDEWQDEPREVMGAIMGMLTGQFHSEQVT